MPPLTALILVWTTWILSWGAAAFWANRTEARPPLMAEAPYRLITLAGAVLLFFPRLKGPALWATPVALKWAMVVLALAGFVFCWWARLHLGRLWSGTVTRKDGHRIVDSGPYALVRHPIYTGLILAAAATAGLKGTAGPALGFALIVLGCWLKARLEERFLAAQLGAETYESYRRRTGMLLPGL